MVAFNILEHISFQPITHLTHNRAHGLNLNYTNTRLESSANWMANQNGMVMECTTIWLTAQINITITTKQDQINKFYKYRLWDK